MAVGPNYNLDVDPEREKQAYDAIQKALQLAAGAPESERAYVEALAKRFTNDPKADLKHLAVNYSDAMRELARRFPDDPDAGALFAESMMDLNPWHLWSNDGKAGAGHRGNRGDARTRAAALAGSCRRESFLHSCARSFALSRARAAERQAAREHGSRRRAFGAHAFAHL